VEGVAHDAKIGAAGLGDHQSLALAIEKLQPEFGLERFHLMADGPLRNKKLLGGAREALMPSGSLEGFQCVKRWHPARHLRLMRKIGARWKNDALHVTPKRTYLPINCAAPSILPQIGLTKMLMTYQAPTTHGQRLLHTTNAIVGFLWRHVAQLYQAIEHRRGIAVLADQDDRLLA